MKKYTFTLSFRMIVYELLILFLLKCQLCKAQSMSPTAEISTNPASDNPSLDVTTVPLSIDNSTKDKTTPHISLNTTLAVDKTTTTLFIDNTTQDDDTSSPLSINRTKTIDATTESLSKDSTSVDNSVEMTTPTPSPLPTNYSGDCTSPESCVFAKIFKGYNKLTRPRLDPSETIEVQMQMVFNGLMEIEEKDEYMRIVGFFRAFWFDDILKWDPAQFSGVDMIIVPAQTIWVPDIGMANSVSDFYEFTYRRDFHLQVHYNGWVRWSFGGVVTTSCDIDLSLYPFDHQHCPVVVESWQYEKAKVRLKLVSGTVLDTDNAEPDPQWILESADGEEYLKYDGRFSALQFNFHWSRKPLYFYINIIMPSIFMGLITLGVFWLPAECGEKMSLGITVVLAFSVFQIVIMEITPVSSDAVPKITELVLTVMTLATFSLLSAMFVSYLREREHRPPHWARKLFLYYIPKVTRLSFYHKYQHEFIQPRAKEVPVQWQDKEVYQKHFGSGKSISSFKSITEGNETENHPRENGSVYSRNNSQQRDTVHMEDVQLSEQPEKHQQIKGEGNSSYIPDTDHSSVPKSHDGIVLKPLQAKARPTNNNGTVPGKPHNSQKKERPSGRERSKKEFVVKDIRGILSILDGMKQRTKDQEEQDAIREEWKYIGRSFDVVIFWLCLLALVGFVAYMAVATHGGL